MKRSFLLLTALALLLSACKSSTQLTLNIMGSTTVAPLLEHLSSKYKQGHDLRINIQSVGSSMGIIAVTDGLADIGMTSRLLSIKEAEFIDQTVIALDAISIIVHPSNPITNLNTDQVIAIFTGKAKNWQDVGGINMPIIVISREAGSGTRSSFEELMHLIAPDKRSLVELSKPLIAEGTGAIKANVANKKQAISYLSIGVLDDAIKAVSLDGIEPREDNVYASLYSLAHPLILLTKKGNKSSPAENFIEFSLSSQGQDIVKEQGLIRVP